MMAYYTTRTPTPPPLILQVTGAVSTVWSEIFLKFSVDLSM